MSTVTQTSNSGGQAGLVTEGLNGWRVHIDEHPEMLTATLYVFRAAGEKTEVYTPTEDERGWRNVFVSAHTRMDPALGFEIPIGALYAIAETLKPGASQGEVKRLEEALTIERRRVDDVLARRDA